MCFIVVTNSFKMVFITTLVIFFTLALSFSSFNKELFLIYNRKKLFMYKKIICLPLWCNGYCRKWTWQPEFKFWTWLFAFSHNSWYYLPTPPLGQDMTQGQFFFFKRSLTGFEFRVFLLLD